jgi:pyruvate/2-oxoglutarate/acetoin dehydrogenase E1 component
VGVLLSYFSELTKAMTWLGQQPDTVFIGQCVEYPGNALFKTLEGVPEEKRIELPVAEEMQLGMSIGMALTGKTVISIFPRMDFLLCAMSQLVNHLDKLENFTHGEYKAKVIIRTAIGSTKPLYPGCQHCGDYTEGIKEMIHNIGIERLDMSRKIMPYYKACYEGKNSVILVEDANLYGMV